MGKSASTWRTTTMCDLCKTFGQKLITEPRALRKAMDAITPEMLKTKGGVEHLRALVDTWMGFEPGPESDDAETAEAWEKSHR